MKTLNETKSTDIGKPPNIIKLTQNENPFGTPPLALKAIENEYHSAFRYPDVLNEDLKSKLAEKYAVTPENIVISAGSVACMDMAIKTFVEIDENVVTTEKTFVAYHILSTINRRECRVADLVENTVRLDNVLALCDEKTKLIFVANPNNPTGTLFHHDPLVRFLETVSSETFVVLDEAYSEYVNDPDYPQSLQLQKTFRNLIILRTFSKIYGLAGLRIGYAIAHPDIRVEMEKRKTPFSINRLAAAAALGALDDTDYIRKCIAVNETERTWLFNQLRELGYKVMPTQANFIMVEFQDEKEKDETYYQLRKEGILVRPLEPFGVKLGLRITVGRPEDNRALIDCLSKLK